MSEIEAINVPSAFAPTSRSLPRSTPEQNGIASSAIHAFLDAVQSEQLGLHSFMLLRHGQVVAEAWWSPYGPERPHAMFSLSKSFTSTAIGLAIEQGLLTVEDRVVSFFPDKISGDDANLQAMRVKHLLTMTTGHSKESMGHQSREKEDWLQHILQQPVEHEPGTHFVYNSGATYVLSAIVQRVTGQTVHDYLQPRLLQPLGIENSTWEQCPHGISTGGWGLSLRTEDVAKFGQLYLQKGLWNGLQLVPEDWVDAATSFQVPNEANLNPDWKVGYGYQFWRSRHGVYRGDGAFGQYCLVMQEQDAVLAITAGNADMQGMLDQVWEHLLPAMSAEPLDANADAYAQLVERLKALNCPPLGSVVESAVAADVSGKRYAVSQNKLHFRQVEWLFDGESCVFKAWSPAGELQVHCGIGCWLEGVTWLGKDRVRIAASGGWQTPSTFAMSWRMVEGAAADIITCTFEGERVILRRESEIRGTSELLLIEGTQE